MAKERILNFYVGFELSSKIRLFGIVAVFAIIVLGIYYGYLASLNSRNLTSKLINKVNNDLGIEVTVEDGDITIFPTLALRLKRVSFENGIFIDRATIKFGLFSTVTDPKISSIKIHNIYTNPNKVGIDNLSYHELLIKLSKLHLSADDIYVDRIWDTKVLNRVIADKLILNKSGHETNLELELLNGIKLSNKVTYVDTDNRWISNVEIYNDNFDFKMRDEFNEVNILDGEFSSNIINLSKATRDISPYFDFIVNNSISSEESVRISGKIVNDKKYLRIEQLNLQGENINASGTYWISSNNTDSDILDITLSQLNIANLISGDQMMRREDASTFRLDRAKVRILVAASEIDIFGDKVKDFKLDSYGDGSSFRILSCNGNIVSGGDFVVTGEVTNNRYRPKFDGYITLNHKDINIWLKNQNLEYLTNNTSTPLYFVSKISVTPLDYEIEDFKVMLSGQTITGSMDLKFIGGKKQLLGSVQFEGLDINNTNIAIIKTSYNYLKSLGQGMFDEIYASKFNVLRSIPIKTTIDINIEDLKVDGWNLDRLSTLVSYDSGLLKVHNFIISDGDKVNFGGYGEILAASVKPQVKLYVTDGSLVLDKFTDEEINSFVEYSEKNINLASIGFISNGYLRNLTIGNLNIQTPYWEVSSENAILNVNSMKFNIFDGPIQSSGNIVFSPVKINLAYGVDGLNIQKLSTYLGNMFPLTSGNISVNGQFSTSGNNYAELLYNLYLNGDFFAKSIGVSNIDLSGTIAKLNSANAGNIKIDALFQQGVTSGSTVFTEAKGSYILDTGILTGKNIVLSAATFNAGAGFAMNFYDSTMDLNSIISFNPVGGKNYNTMPIKLRLQAKGNINTPDKLLQFLDGNDIYRMQRILYGYDQNARKPN